MFNKAIFSTQLTGDTADRLFANITSESALDCTFLTTMRCILHKRLPKNESVHLRIKPLYYSLQEIENASLKQAMNWFVSDAINYPTNSQHNIVIVHTTSPDSGEKMLEIIKSNAKRSLPKFAVQEDLRVFYARKCNALFYHNVSENKTIIFTDKLGLKHFHALQIMLPKYIPSLFSEFPLDDSETDLLKSLGNKSAVEYEKIIDKFAKDLDIRAEIIRTKLHGFETAFERRKLDEIKNEIINCENNYEYELSKIREIAAKIQEKKYTLAGLECSIQERLGDSELMEYFMCNKSLSIIKVAGTTIEFVAHGYADIYDIDAFEQYVGNHNGYFYSGLNTQITKPQMEKLYRAIFGENTLRLRICAAYSADVSTGIRALQHYNFPPESRDYFPNPHIQEYGCIGTYAMRFQEYMQKRDYVGGIDQSVISARNLNFYDSAAIGIFARNLSHSSII